MHFISTGGAFRDALSLLEIFYARVSFSRLRNLPVMNLAEEFLRTRITACSNGYICVTRKATSRRDPLCKLCLRAVKCVHSHLEIIMAKLGLEQRNDSYRFARDRELI